MNRRVKWYIKNFPRLIWNLIKSFNIQKEERWIEYWETYDALDDIFIHPFRKIWYGIGNIIAYAPIIYRDRDWDHSDFLKLMRFKLKRMEYNIRINDRHTTSDEDARNIRRCIFLLDRLIAEDYFSLPENKNFKGRYDFGEYMHDQDMKWLMKILNKHLREWWN